MNTYLYSLEYNPRYASLVGYNRGHVDSVMKLDGTVTIQHTLSTKQLT